MQLTVGEMKRDSLFTSVSNGILCQELAGKTVLLNIVNGDYFGMNEVDSRVWTLLRSGEDLGEVCRELLKKYDVSEVEFKQDVGRFLSQLEQRGLVEIHEKMARKRLLGRQCRR